MEHLCNRIVGVRLSGNKEAVDVDVFVDVIPSNIVSVKADLIMGTCKFLV